MEGEGEVLYTEGEAREWGREWEIAPMGEMLPSELSRFSPPCRSARIPSP